MPSRQGVSWVNAVFGTERKTVLSFPGQRLLPILPLLVLSPQSDPCLSAGCGNLGSPFAQLAPTCLPRWEVTCRGHIQSWSPPLRALVRHEKI